MVERSIQTGVIDQAWATELAENASQGNRESGSSNIEQLQVDINLEELGGLAVKFMVINPPLSYEFRRNLHSSDSMIELAYEKPAWGTLTHYLYDAAKAQRGTDDTLTQQLLRRTKPTIQHGGNEAWFFPTDVIELIEDIRTK